MDNKVPPVRFSADLFSSPGTAGLSLGLDGSLNSSISLGPALTTSNDENPPTTSTIPKPSSSSQRSSPAPGDSSEVKEMPQSVQPTADLDNTNELSTVPLDSPVLSSSTSESLPVSSAPTGILHSSTDTDQLRQGSVPVKQHGWNDPPSATYSPYTSTPHRPQATKSSSSSPFNPSTSTGDIQIQPLAGNINQTPGPPPQTGASSNPYRIGTGIGSRKPAYGVSGIASFGGPTSSVPPATGQPSEQVMVPSQVGYSGQPSEQTMIPSQVGYQPIQPSSSLQSKGIASGAPPPTSGFGPSSSSTPLSGSTVGSELAGGFLPISHHWFYLRSQEKYWIPFSLTDSKSLESAFFSCQDPSQQIQVPTDGGRYDVDLFSRQRQAVYWSELEPASEVRRCSWFYKGESDRWFLPYSEATALRLEEEYQVAVGRSTWNHRVDLDGGEYVVMHSHSSIVHYPSSSSSTLSDLDESYPHPKAVMRGFADLDKVETGEQPRIDHLVFVVHGIGAHHDISFRSLVDCVDDFREVSQLMLKTHEFARQASHNGDGGGRVEFLPVHWHSKLHTSGVDDHLRPLTLPSIGRLRDFTNSTLLDILYFTSPLFCQTIVSEVASEMNRMYKIFQSRNPSFLGGVSVMGHSLGSVILFDLLYHQHHAGSQSTMNSQTISADTQQQVPEFAGKVTETGRGVVEEEEEETDATTTTTVEEVLTQLNLESYIEKFQHEQVDFDSLLMCSNDDLKELGLAMGPRKKLSSFITQQNEDLKLRKERKAKEAAKKLEQEQKELKARRASVETKVLKVKIIQGLAGTGQTYVEYPQLMFQPQQLFLLGSPLGLFLTVRGVEGLAPEFSLPTCSSVFNIFHPFDPVAYRVEPLVVDGAPEKAVLMPHHKGRKRFHLELYENLGNVGASIVEGMRNMWQQLNEFARSHTTGSQSIDQSQQKLPDTATEVSSLPDSVDSVADLKEENSIGALNQGRRIDYVLQEKPIEKLNEYLFAISSHLCYWHSEDTALFLLKEVYQELNPTLVKS